MSGRAVSGGRKLVWTLLAGVAGYLVGAAGGMVLVPLLSPNAHDRPVEAAMTSIFVYGPAMAIVCALLGLIRR